MPTFRKINPAALPVLILALTSEDHRRRAPSTTPPTPSVVQRIAQVEGVADVTVSGAEQPAVRVQVNPACIASARHQLDGAGAHRDRRPRTR